MPTTTESPSPMSSQDISTLMSYSEKDHTQKMKIKRESEKRKVQSNSEFHDELLLVMSNSIINNVNRIHTLFISRSLEPSFLWASVTSLS